MYIDCRRFLYEATTSTSDIWLIQAYFMEIRSRLRPFGTVDFLLEIQHAIE
jgi:hypothetical protein